MKMAVLCLAVATTLLGGCASSSPIQRYSESKSAFHTEPVLISHDVPDKGVYRVYHRASSGFVSIQSIREAAEKRAKDFCDRQGKGMLLLGEKTSDPPYILGNFPRIEIVFACVDKPNTAAVPGAETTKFQRLGELKRLLDDGTLSREEFEREKTKVLNTP